MSVIFLPAVDRPTRPSLHRPIKISGAVMCECLTLAGDFAGLFWDSSAYKCELLMPTSADRNSWVRGPPTPRAFVCAGVSVWLFPHKIGADLSSVGEAPVPGPGRDGRSEFADTAAV